MNQVFNQSKNKRIIVISFQSLSSITNTVNNVFELFASFKAANALNHWNLSLIQAVQNCILVGHIDPHVIMLGGSENYLEIIKLAWMKQILKAPLGFTIQYLGELCNFLVSKTPQCSTVELEEAICKCVCELVNTGLPSNLKYIIRHVTKFLPMTGDSSLNDSENFLSTEMIKSIIDGLQQKGLVYNTGHGYNVMTADKLRVAKWLGELPDMRMSFSGPDSDDKRATQSIQRPAARFLVNREHSDNTDDCLSCYDLRGNKYYTQQSTDQKLMGQDTRYGLTNERYRTNCLDIVDNNGARDNRVVSTDTSLNKPRMLCSNVSKKDLSKRPNCVKYESNFISRIICGMKKLRIHWPAKNGVIRSTNIGVPDLYNQHQQQHYFSGNYKDEANVINSRLSRSMYAFNQLNGHGALDHSRPSFSAVNEHFVPYGGDTKSISPVAGHLGQCYGLNYTHNDNEQSFILMEEQRCCSELMLTGRSSLLSPANLYAVAPSDATKKEELSLGGTMKEERAVTAVTNHNHNHSRYFSPFTCDSGFNSVHGGAPLLPDTEASQSKTSSPPDLNNLQKLSQSLYSGGPCAWQVNSLHDNVLYQTRTNYHQSPVLAPVLETSSRYKK